MTFTRSPSPVLISFFIIVAASLAMVAALVVLRVRRAHRHRESVAEAFSNGGHGSGSPHLSVLHTRPAERVQLRAGGDGGDGQEELARLPAELLEAWHGLNARGALDVVVDTQADKVPACAKGAVCVWATDLPTLEAGRGPLPAADARLVTALPGPEGRRALLLVTQDRRGAPGTLAELASLGVARVALRFAGVTERRLFRHIAQWYVGPGAEALRLLSASTEDAEDGAGVGDPPPGHASEDSPHHVAVLWVTLHAGVVERALPAWSNASNAGGLLPLRLVSYADELDAGRWRVSDPTLSREVVRPSDVLPGASDMHDRAMSASVVAAPCLLITRDRHPGDARGDAMLAEFARVTMGKGHATRQSDVVTLTTLHGMRSRMRMSPAADLVLTELSARIASQQSEVAGEDIVVGRPRRSVLEQFEGAPAKSPTGAAVRLRSTNDLPGVVTFAYESRHRTLQLRHGVDGVDGVPLRRGDRVELRGQARASEDGVYVVSRAGRRDGGGATLESPLRLAPQPLHPLRLEHGAWVVDVRAEHELAVGEDVLLPLGPDEPRDARLFRVYQDATTGRRVAAGTVQDVGAGGRARVRLEPWRDEAQHDTMHPLARCVGRPHVLQRVLCEREGGVWDRPCQADTECPFFKSNRNYDNHRGGCTAGGQCELPMGLTPRGFRGYQGGAAEDAVCHGIAGAVGRCGTLPPPGLLSPDYAFAGDLLERLNRME